MSGQPNALFVSCPLCGGGGSYFDIPQHLRPRASGGGMPASECPQCDGWGIVPTEAGKPMFELVLAMRRSPRWR